MSIESLDQEHAAALASITPPVALNPTAFALRALGFALKRAGSADAAEFEAEADRQEARS